MISLTAALGIAQAAIACEMASADRASENAAYVENGQICLDTPPEGFAFEAEMEADFIALINEEREAENLPALTVRPDMEPAARFHSLDMAFNSYFGHDSPAGRVASGRIAAFDRTLIASFTAENVASEARSCTDGDGNKISCGPAQKRPPSETLKHLHGGLMDSPGHRANIMSKKATTVALGVVRRGDDVFVTQLFAAPAGELSRPAPLRIEAGFELPVTTRLADWEDTRLGVVQDDIQITLEDGQLPASLGGDFSIEVRGETKADPVRRGNQIIQSCEFIELPGPIITVLPATGS